MTDLECQALLIRAEYAHDLVGTLDEEDRAELLYSVLRPSQELLSGSLARAQEEGVSKLARTMAAGIEARERQRSAVEVAAHEKGLARDERPAPVRAPGAPIVWATP